MLDEITQSKFGCPYVTRIDVGKLGCQARVKQNAERRKCEEHRSSALTLEDLYLF